MRREMRRGGGRCVQQLPGQAFAGPDQQPGLFPGQVRDQADARAPRPTASCSTPTSRRRRPASSSCRRAIRASSKSSSRRTSPSRTSAARARRRASASTIRAIPSRSRPGFTEPYLFDRNIAVGIDLFRRDYNAFNYIGDEPQHHVQPDVDRLPDPRRRAADRVSGRCPAAMACRMTRSASTRVISPTVSATRCSRAATCATRSATGGRRRSATR